MNNDNDLNLHLHDQIVGLASLLMMFTYFQIAHVKHNILKQENRLKKVEKLHNTLYTCHIRMINIHLIYRLPG